jgi:hypothetical protein
MLRLVTDETWLADFVVTRNADRMSGAISAPLRRLLCFYSSASGASAETFPVNLSALISSKSMLS